MSGCNFSTDFPRPCLLSRRWAFTSSTQSTFESTLNIPFLGLASIKRRSREYGQAMGGGNERQREREREEKGERAGGRER